MKKSLCFVLIATLFLCAAVPAWAEETTGGDWYVHFTKDAKMESNFDAVQGDVMSEAMYALQPGDRATFYMEIKNEHVESTDWYMTNEVLRSLEHSQEVAEGGAYTYILTYHGPDGTADMLYSSDSVGGEDEENVDGREGLREATSSLEDWFYLDTLKTGESGTVTLVVELEGETQGNKYQDTLAQVQMNFAVELTQEQTKQTVYKPVKTGDEEPTLLWSSVTLGCGLAALALALLRMRRREENENA